MNACMVADPLGEEGDDLRVVGDQEHLTGDVKGRAAGGCQQPLRACRPQRRA